MLFIEGCSLILTIFLFFNRPWLANLYLVSTSARNGVWAQPWWCWDWLSYIKVRRRYQMLDKETLNYTVNNKVWSWRSNKMFRSTQQEIVFKYEDQLGFFRSQFSWIGIWCLVDLGVSWCCWINCEGVKAFCFMFILHYKHEDLLIYIKLFLCKAFPKK